MTTNRIKAYGALAGMFILGGVCAAGTYHALARRGDAEFFSADPAAFEARRVEAMGRELGLSDEQRGKLLAIFQKHAGERQRLLRQEIETCGGPMNEHRERVDNEIRALLTPEQRTRFETLRVERHRRLFGTPDPRPRPSR